MKGEPTLLGDDVKFSGKLHLNDTLTINGEFTGYIQSAAEINIGVNSKVNADIDAVEVIVFGQAQGNIFASKKIELRKHSQVVGDVRTAGLQIDLGAKLRGSCLMD